MAAPGKWKPPFTAGWSPQNVGLGQGVYIIYLYVYIYTCIVICPVIFKTTKFLSRTYKTPPGKSIFFSKDFDGDFDWHDVGELASFSGPLDEDSGSIRQLTSFQMGSFPEDSHGTNGIFTYICIIKKSTICGR